MTTPDPRDLWLMQLRLECKEIDAEGWLVRSPGDKPDAIPDCTLVRFATSYDLAFSRSADAELREQIRQVGPSAFFNDRAAAAFLSVPGLELLRCSTYHFVETVAAARDRPAEIVQQGPESFTTIVNGQAVAWATSARSNGESAELWVHTDPAQLRHGYARQVAIAWAAAVTGSGKVAFYSHLADNEPSRQLARSLGVTHLFDLAALTAKS